MSRKKKFAGLLIGLGFIVPSVIGLIWPLASAEKYQLVLDAQSAID